MRHNTRRGCRASGARICRGIEVPVLPGWADVWYRPFGPVADLRFVLAFSRRLFKPLRYGLLSFPRPRWRNAVPQRLKPSIAENYGTGKPVPFVLQSCPGNDSSRSVTNLVFIGRSPSILAPFKLCSSICCIIAGAMGNHLHVATSSLATSPVVEGPQVGHLWQETSSPAHVSGTFGRYRVRLAQDVNDRIAACRLRFNVFNVELGEGLSSSYSTGLDRDRFDSVCDHLIVEDQEDGQVVGTYRMQSGLIAGAAFGYYSAQEFEFAPYECYPTTGPGAWPRLDRSPAPFERSAHPALEGDCPIRQVPRAAVPYRLLFSELEESPRRLEPLPAAGLATGFIRVHYGSNGGVCAAP